MKKIRFCLLLAVIAFIISACTTTKTDKFFIDLPDMNEELTKKDYAAVRSEIDLAKKYDELSVYNQKNDISYLMDRGMMAYFDGDYKGSSPDLLEAERLIEEAFTKSISDNFSAAISKDPTKAEYPGEDFENVYINIFNALNFYNLGDMEKALVEVRRVNEKLVYMNDQYEAYQQRLIAKFREVPFNSVKYYANSALANYLAMLLWRAGNNPDSARIDAQNITRAFTEAQHLYTHPIPSELVMRNDNNDELSIPRGQARLNFIVFTGLSPFKMGLEKAHFQVSDNLKVLVYRNSPVDRIEIAFANGTKKELSLLEPMDAITQEIFETRENHRRKTQALYGIAKDTAGLVGTWTIDLLTLGMGEGKIGVRTEKQKNTELDMRMSQFLPGKAYVGGVTLAPGTYSFTINYYSGKNLVTSKRIENRNITEKGLNLVQDAYLAYNLYRTPKMLNDQTIAAMPNFNGRLPAPSSGNNDPVPGAVVYYIYYDFENFPFSKPGDYYLLQISDNRSVGFPLEPLRGKLVVPIGAGGMGVPLKTR